MDFTASWLKDKTDTRWKSEPLAGLAWPARRHTRQVRAVTAAYILALPASPMARHSLASGQCSGFGVRSSGGKRLSACTACLSSLGLVSHLPPGRECPRTNLKFSPLTQLVGKTGRSWNRDPMTAQGSLQMAGGQAVNTKASSLTQKPSSSDKHGRPELVAAGKPEQKPRGQRKVPRLHGCCAE